MTQLAATVNPGQINEDSFFFTPPSLTVNSETHQAIEGEFGGAEDRLRLVLADATRELCRRTLEDEISGFDFRTDPNNCDDYDEAWVNPIATAVEPGEPDIKGAHIQEDPTCYAACLLENCSDYETGGDHDDPPEHPFVFTVRCHCQVEDFSGCGGSSSLVMAPEIAEAPGFQESYCVPEGSPPAEYCRIDVADYLNASIRVVNHYSWRPFDPLGTCGDYVPGLEDITVTCRPVGQDGDIEDEAAEAYIEQDDACAPGCSNLACDDLQIDLEDDDWRPCSQEIGSNLPSECDCDILPADCFENDVIAGVCLPDGMGSIDGGSDDGGGSNRLRSAINLLAGQWLASQDYTCSQMEPGGSYTPNPGNPPPTSAHSPYALTNGTSFTTGLHHTCPAPSTDDVRLSTFDTTLEELCLLIPLCSYSNDLSLTITATDDTTLLASGTLAKTGASISTTEGGAPLSVGDHTLDLCIEHDPTEFVSCVAQSIRASAPLGSGVDGHGYFAGELAPDFVEIAGLPGAMQLSLTDDGYTRIVLPSGFSFPFYGTTVWGYLWVGANGGINTTASPVAAANTGLPATSAAQAPDIAVYWDDLDPSSGGGVYAWFDGVRLIVSWEDVPHGRDGSASTTDGVSVQAHIYESGRIELHYLDTDVGDSNYDHGVSATIGIGNLAGTEAVEVSHDDDGLLTSDVTAVGIALASDGCLADGLVIPPQVACAAPDHYLTVCTPTGDTVTLPLPDVSQCASGAIGVAGEVVESGTKESTLVLLSTPISIDGNGEVELDEGAHRIRWWPVDGQGEQVGPAFTQIVLARTWVHTACGGSGQSMLAFTDGDDSYEAAPQSNALALFGLPGEDVLSSAAGNDFIGDGPGAGICEAHDGDDWLVGEDGDDTLDGGSGHDHAWGGTGEDLLVGGPGDDVLHGQEGDDILQGGDDDDELWGGLGDDVLEGDDGADTLYPGSGVDAVYGGAGDDVIVILDACELTSGKLLSGGSGADTLLLPPGLDAQDLAAAGVTVDADVETITTSPELPIHRASCEPS